MQQDLHEATSDGISKITIANRSEIQERAKEAKENRKLPEKPGNKVSFDQLLVWLKSLSPDMLDGDRVWLFVYRQRPVINNQMVDPNALNNIDVIYGDFSNLNREYFVNRHGGGVYRIIVKDQDNGKAQKGGFFEAKLEIPETEAPPKVDLKTVDWSHPSNKGYQTWCRANGLIDEKNMPTITEKKIENQPAINDSTVSLMKEVLGFVTKLNEKDQNELKRKIGGEDALSKSVGDILLEKMKQDDPNKQITMLTTLLAALKSSQPEPKNSELATVMPMFLQMMTAAQERSDKMFMAMMELLKRDKGDSEPPNKISELKDLLEIAREIKGGNSGSKSTAEVIVDGLAGIAAPALQIVANIMQLKAQQNGQMVSNPATVTSEPQVSTNPQIDAPNKVVEMPQLNANEAANMIKTYAPIIYNKLGQEGWEFGAWVAEGFGDATATQITRYGADKLFEGAKMVPDFFNQVMSTYGEEHFKKWLGDLCNYKEIIKKMEEDEVNDAS